MDVHDYVRRRSLYDAFRDIFDDAFHIARSESFIFGQGFKMKLYVMLLACSMEMLIDYQSRLSMLVQRIQR